MRSKLLLLLFFFASDTPNTCKCMSSHFSHGAKAFFQLVHTRSQHTEWSLYLRVVQLCTTFQRKRKMLQSLCLQGVEAPYTTAADRNRTGTGITTHGILSPGRLPVPPLRQISNCIPSADGKRPRRDSNSRPPPWQGGALTNWATGPRHLASVLWTLTCKWTFGDSNPGPTGYEPVALTNWAKGPNNDCSRRNKADDRTWTDNLLITNQLLCQLSHIGVKSDPDGNRTRVTAVKGRCLNRLTTGPKCLQLVSDLPNSVLHITID